MELLTFFPLAFMICSDFRKRKISLYLLLCFGGLAAISGCAVYGTKVCLCRVGVNGGVLLLMIGCVMLYLLAKFGWRRNMCRRFVGTGDWLFLFCLTPLFGFKEYVWFLVVAFVFSLIWWLIYTGKRSNVFSIPLVSTVGICYMVYLLFRLFFKYIGL